MRSLLCIWYGTPYTHESRKISHISQTYLMGSINVKDIERKSEEDQRKYLKNGKLTFVVEDTGTLLDVVVDLGDLRTALSQGSQKPLISAQSLPTFPNSPLQHSQSTKASDKGGKNSTLLSAGPSTHGPKEVNSSKLGVKLKQPMSPPTLSYLPRLPIL